MAGVARLTSVVSSSVSIRRYLEYWAQPAEYRVAATDVGADVSQDLAQILRGHYVLLFVLVTALMAINTEPPAWQPTPAYAHFDMDVLQKKIQKEREAREAKEAAEKAKEALEKGGKSD